MRASPIPLRALVLTGLALRAGACAAPRAELPEELRDGVVFTVAQQFRTPPQGVRLAGWERERWPDGCLGIPHRLPCAPGPTPGYRYRLDIAGQPYEYRAPAAEPLELTLARGPAPAAGPEVLEWEGLSDGRCRRLTVSADARAAFGPCGAPQTGLPLLEETRRPDELRELLERFAPFEHEGPAGRLVFRGRGGEAATPAWRDAVAAWAANAFLEVSAGRSGASWTSALAWRRPLPERPGYCAFLSVETYGKAYAATARCEGGDARSPGGGWLAPEAWEPFHGWLRGRAPVYLDGGALQLFALGEQPMREAEIDSLRAWVEAVSARLRG